MKKNYFWLLITLMAISLIGIIVIQSFWINWSINLNQEKFDKEVFSALNHVEQELAAKENTLDLSALSAADLTKTGGAGPGLNMLGKSPGSFKKQLTLLEGLEVTKLLLSKDLTERVDIKLLSNLIRRHLERRYITSIYHYGVYDNDIKGFVILDDNFVVVEEGNQFTNTSFNASLLNSTYRINLFELENGEVPGVLFIDFPERRSIIFRDVWPTILGSPV